MAFRKLGLEELRAYDDWGRAVLERSPSMGYKALRTKLQDEHTCTAGNSTMQRWLSLLSTPVRKRPAAGPAYENQSIEQLSAYDVWGREQVSQNAELTYRQL